MKKILLVTVLFTSGLFSSLYGDSKFAPWGADNEQFKVDTKKARAAAYILDRYHSIKKEDNLHDLIEGDWFQDLPKTSKNKVRQDTTDIVEELAKNGEKVFVQMTSIGSNMYIVAAGTGDVRFFNWAGEFSDDNSKLNEDYLFDTFFRDKGPISSQKNWDDLLILFQKDIAAQQKIIEAYKDKYSEILKNLGCSGEVCKRPAPIIINKEL